ncbi:MAG: HD domain-containing protein [Bdellovibrionales bacterium]|nr:HD domain-containing protein [Bdellovibrionales bacterium]
MWADELLRCSTPEEVVELACRVPIIAHALALLESEVPPHYIYHNHAHTLDVMHEVALFAIHDGVQGQDLLLLLIAAAWHDIGFIKEELKDHEEAAVQFFQETIQEDPKLAVFHASEQIMIEQMILDTKLYPSRNGPGLEQIPHTKLSKYLLDADLSNLGRDDFFSSMEKIRQELSAPEKEFSIQTLGLITRHIWHTRIAQEMRTEKELQNNLQLVRKIKKMLQGS